MVVTNRARAHEHIPATRARSAYALKRAVRTGQLYARLRVKGHGLVRLSGFALGSIAKTVLFAVVGALVWPFSRPRAFRLFVRSSLNLGKLREITGAKLLLSWS